MPIASVDAAKHYTVNLMESLTLEDEISKHVEISLDEKISLTDNLSNSSTSSFSESISWLIDSLSTLISNNQ